MTKNLLLFVMVAATVLTVGCSKKPDEQTACTQDSLDKITDPAQKAELLKRCPRLGGPKFKASEQKEY